MHVHQPYNHTASCIDGLDVAILNSAHHVHLATNCSLPFIAIKGSLNSQQLLQPYFCSEGLRMTMKPNSYNFMSVTLPLPTVAHHCNVTMSMQP